MLSIKSLRTKTLLWVLIPTALVLVIVTVIALYAYEWATLDVVKERDAELARISAARLSENLGQYSRILQSTAAEDDVQSMELTRLSSALEEAQNQLYVFDAGVVVYNSEGVALWSQPFVAERQGTDCPVPSEFNKVSSTLQPAFSNVFVDTTSGEDVILVAVPLTGSDGEFNGVLAGMFEMKYPLLGAIYAEVIQLKVGKSGYAYLVDGNGQVIYHPDGALMGTNLADTEPVMQALRGETSAIRTDDSAGEFVISGFAPVPDTGWGLITQERWGEVIGPVKGVSRLLFALLVVGGVISSVLIFFSIGRILKPIRDLTQGAQRIAGGDFEHTITAKTGDEIQGLAQQFNTMAGALKESYASLEQKIEEVGDRTRELEKLEQLGRAIINAPPDASALSDVLREYIPNMFPDSQIAICIFPGRIVLHHPDDRPPVIASIWEWLCSTPEAHCFLPGAALPWEEQPANNAVVVAPILDMESKEPIGGIYLSLLRDPDAVASLLPAVQTLAAQIASALYHAKVDAETLAHQKVEHELALAGQIQASFLPDDLPNVPGWQLAAMLKPARETCGDFYDVIPLPNGRLGILIADVTDKGMGAALYMALSRTLIRTYAVEYDTQPELVLSAANRRILADTRAGLFVTVFYGVLDPATGTLTYSNAGHNPPYLLSAQNHGAVQELDRTGIPLGMFESGAWEQRVVHLTPGDVLVLYSDGITEAQNAQEAFFDEERLLGVVQNNLGRSAQDIQDALIAEVNAFVGDAPQFDDITLMVVIRGSTEAG